MEFLTLDQIRSCRGKTIVLDTETTGLEWYRQDIIGVGIHCPQAGVSGYFPTCTYEEVAYGKEKSRKVWLGKRDYSKSSQGRKVLETITEQKKRNTAIPDKDLIYDAMAAIDYMAYDPKTTLIGHNLKFDAHFCNLLLYHMPCKILDTAVMVHLYDSRLRKSLDKAEEYFLGTNSKREHVELAKGESRLMPWNWDLHHLAEYCTNDCIVTYQLAEVLMKEMKAWKLDKLLNLQMKYLRALQRIERRGLMLDFNFMLQAEEVLSSNLVQLEKDLYASCGKEFNWRSGAQLSRAIYDDMGIEKPENPFADADGVDRSRMAHVNKYNKYRTSSFILMEKGSHPLGGLILEMRECDKLVKFLQGYRELADEYRVMHGTFNPTGTRTGRLSSSKPNLQNIPSAHRAREDTGVFSGGGVRQGEYNLRQAIISKPGYTLVSVDHRQQEMRMFGILAQEPVMMEALRNREDIHMRVAISVWGDCGPELNDLHREWSKAIGFGLIYGMTTGSLQYKLNKTPEEAQQIAQQYWNTFPRIQPWLNEVIHDCMKKGYVRYWDGRIWREEDPLKAYKGANAQIQGGAAGIMSVAIVRADEVIAYNDWGGVASIIHDEAIFEIRDTMLEIAVPVIAKIMEVEDLFNLPFPTDVKIGKSYGTLAKPDFPVFIDNLNWRDYLPPKNLEGHMVVKRSETGRIKATQLAEAA
jgi:DNA polymerase-1